MDDLVAFLRARLDEDEATAQAAADFGGGIHGFDWSVSGSHADDGGTYWRVAATARASGHEQFVEIVGPGVSGGGAHTEQVAHHVVRHDPARVLREVKAKRQLLALYEEHKRLDRETFEAEGQHARSLSSLRAAYFDAVRFHAAVYAAHPDYRPDWAPEA